MQPKIKNPLIHTGQHPQRCLLVTDHVPPEQAGPPTPSPYQAQLARQYDLRPLPKHTVNVGKLSSSAARDASTSAASSDAGISRCPVTPITIGASPEA